MCEVRTLHRAYALVPYATFACQYRVIRSPACPFSPDLPLEHDNPASASGGALPLANSVETRRRRSISHMSPTWRTVLIQPRSSPPQSTAFWPDRAGRLFGLCIGIPAHRPGRSIYQLVGASTLTAAIPSRIEGPEALVGSRTSPAPRKAFDEARHGVALVDSRTVPG